MEKKLCWPLCIEAPLGTPKPHLVFLRLVSSATSACTVISCCCAHALHYTFWADLRVYVNSQARCFPFFTTSASFLLQMHTRALTDVRKNSRCKRCMMTCLKVEIFHNKCPVVHHLYITVVIATLNVIDGGMFSYTGHEVQNSMFSSIVLCVFHIVQRRSAWTSCRKTASALSPISLFLIWCNFNVLH